MRGAVAGNMRQIEARFEAEEARAAHYLSSHTAAPLRQILQDQLLTPHLLTVISMPNSGLDVMIDLDKIDDLARLYRLFTTVPLGLPTLRKALKDTLDARGKAINTAGLAGDADADADGLEVDAGPATKAKSKGKAPAPGAGAQTLRLALKWVEDVLALKDKFDGVWRQSFQNDRDLESGLNEVGDSARFGVLVV